MNRKSDMNEFKQLEDLLINTDVESSKYEDIILNRLKYKIETGTIQLNNIKKENIYMKKKLFKHSRFAALALVTVICGASITYGSEILSSIIAHFQVGNTEITQYDMDKEPKSADTAIDEISPEALQEGFKGKLFDKNGKDAVYGEHQEYYTAEGEKITSIMVKDLPNGNHEFVVSTEENDSNNQKILTLEEVKKVANRNIKLSSYLPQGYIFKEATTSFEGAGVNVVYENKSRDTIVILASTTKEATCGVVTTDAVTETSIDGKKVTLSTNCAFWESKNVTYQLYWNFENSNDGEVPSMDMTEVSKIIQSMK